MPTEELTRARPGPVPGLLLAPPAAGLALVVASSVDLAGWAPGTGALPGLALIAAALGAAACLLAARSAAAVGVAALAIGGELLAWEAGSGGVALPGLAHPAGAAGTSPLELLLTAWCCAAAGWLMVAVLRLRLVVAGLLPLGALFAVTLLNYPDGEGGRVALFLALTVALLLGGGMQRLRTGRAAAAVAGGRPPGAKLWASAGALGALAIGGGLWLPPASSVDRSSELGALHDLVELQQRLSGAPSTALAAAVGFSTDLLLGGALQETGGVVLTYFADGAASTTGPLYMRGVNLAPDRSGGWRFVPAGSRSPLTGGGAAPGSDGGAGTATAAYLVDVVTPPAGAESTLFYPGTLVRVDRNVELVQGRPGFRGDQALHTVDQVLAGSTSAGAYRVEVAFSTASEDQLRAAGTDYPAWLRPYRQQAPPLAASDRSRIRDLALRITAGATNPYDQAAAIESYLRSHYRYTLTPPTPPAGTDPVGFFLFTSREGYCQFFAASMGDLLLALGLPTRLVNGFGPGTWDPQHDYYVVRTSDAHTWVEVFFPGYGWIPFEPTPASPYVPIPRGGAASQACSAAACASPDAGATAPGGAAAAVVGAAPAAAAGVAAALGVRPPTRGQIDALAAVAAAVAAALAFAALVFLSPRRAGAAWRRAVILGRLAGVPARRWETPLEFGRRLSSAVPEARDAVGALAEAVSVVSYAPPAVARTHVPAVRRAWRSARPALLRGVGRRLARALPRRPRRG